MAGRLVVLTLLVALVLAPFALDDLPGAQPDGDRVPDGAEEAQVARVADGDPITVNLNGDPVRVRLIGVDTPETVDPNRPVGCFGPEASDRTAAMLPQGRTVWLEKDVSETD